MKYQEIIKILENEDYISEPSVDNALEGLNLLAKYINDQELIQGAEHDVIYSVDIDDLEKYDVPKDVIIRLRNLGFFEEGGYLRHHV